MKAVTDYLMIYGATGHTGKLLVWRAVRDGRRVIVAGRSAEKLRPLAESLGVEYRVAEVGDLGQMTRALSGVDVLLNAAGPFSATASSAVAACLRTGTHYVDVGGELGPFRALQAEDRAARASGIVLLPGAGLLVTATDCLAAHVAKQLPTATALALALSRPAVLARGSLRTMVTLVDDRVRVRRGGQIEEFPVGSLNRSFNLGAGPVTCTAISGAEVLATFVTTGITNIEVYAPASAAERAVYRAGALLAPMLKRAPARLALRAFTDYVPLLPAGKDRRQVVVAIATDRAGRRVARRLTTRAAYESTVTMALDAVDRVRTTRQRGFCTPGRLCGPDYLFSLPGVALEALT